MKMTKAPFAIASVLVFISACSSAPTSQSRDRLPASAPTSEMSDYVRDLAERAEKLRASADEEKLASIERIFATLIELHGGDEERLIQEAKTGKLEIKIPTGCTTVLEFLRARAKKPDASTCD